MSVALASIAVAAASLVVAVAGGLLRACPAAAPPALAGWLVAGASSHAALMICGFLATLVAAERAVAVRSAWGALAPACSALGAALLIAGDAVHGRMALLLAAIVLLVVSLAIARRQPAPHTVLLTVGAAAWLVGDAMFLADAGAPVPWWFAFLVSTVAAERLEMTRLLRRAPGTGPQLGLAIAVLLAGAACASTSGATRAFGTLLFGGGLVLLSAWLFAHDVATRTIRTSGLSRYMALCLLLGYGWLALSGLGWIGLAFGRPWRDLALHALGLGFMASMVMAHAPVIVPALTRVRLRFGPAFYLPVALLHVSLAIRLGPGLGSVLERGVGACLNALALLLFVLTVAGAAVAWRIARAGAGAGAPRPEAD